VGYVKSDVLSSHDRVRSAVTFSLLLCQLVTGVSVAEFSAELCVCIMSLMEFISLITSAFHFLD